MLLSISTTPLTADPDHKYVLDLSYWDERELAGKWNTPMTVPSSHVLPLDILVALAITEPGENWIGENFNVRIVMLCSFRRT